MDFKEFLWTMAAVAIGLIVGTMILSKLPSSVGGGGNWEQD